MDVLRILMTESPCRLIGADVVEFVPSPTPPGCDIIAARLVAKVLAWQFRVESRGGAGQMGFPT